MHNSNYSDSNIFRMVTSAVTIVSHDLNLYVLEHLWILSEALLYKFIFFHRYIEICDLVYDYQTRSCLEEMASLDFIFSDSLEFVLMAFIYMI